MGHHVLNGKEKRRQRLPLSLALPEENLKPWVRCSPAGQTEISALCSYSGRMWNFPRRNLKQKIPFSFGKSNASVLGFLPRWEWDGVSWSLWRWWHRCFTCIVCFREDASVSGTEPNTRQDKTQPKWVSSGQNGLENEWSHKGNTKCHQSAGLQGFTVPSLHSTQPSPEWHCLHCSPRLSLTPLQIYFGVVTPSLAFLRVTSKLGRKIMFQDAKDVTWSMGRELGLLAPLQLLHKRDTREKRAPAWGRESDPSQQKTPSQIHELQSLEQARLLQIFLLRCFPSLEPATKKETTLCHIPKGSAKVQETGSRGEQCWAVSATALAP